MSGETVLDTFPRPKKSTSGTHSRQIHGSHSSAVGRGQLAGGALYEGVGDVDKGLARYKGSIYPETQLVKSSRRLDVLIVAFLGLGRQKEGS
jgi:hypothetical protein